MTNYALKKRIIQSFLQHNKNQAKTIAAKRFSKCKKTTDKDTDNNNVAEPINHYDVIPDNLDGYLLDTHRPFNCKIRPI